MPHQTMANRLVNLWASTSVRRGKKLWPRRSIPKKVSPAFRDPQQIWKSCRTPGGQLEAEGLVAHDHPLACWTYLLTWPMFACNVGSPKGEHSKTLIISLQFSEIHVQRKGWITDGNLHRGINITVPTFRVSRSFISCPRVQTDWGISVISSNHNETSHRTPNCNRKNETPGSRRGDHEYVEFLQVLPCRVLFLIHVDVHSKT